MSAKLAGAVECFSVVEEPSDPNPIFFYSGNPRTSRLWPGFMCTGLVIAFQCVIHSKPTTNKDIDKRKYNKRKARQAQQHEIIVESFTTMALQKEGEKQ